MKELERIEAAEEKFNAKFGQGDDEWTETFDLACRFARRLVDCTDSAKLLGDVVEWIEEAAEQDDN
jgi:hypothetical protein